MYKRQPSSSNRACARKARSTSDPVAISTSCGLSPELEARLAIEAGVAQGWHRYVGQRGKVLSVEGYGASAPGDRLLREYGFGVENVLLLARQILG